MLFVPFLVTFVLVIKTLSFGIVSDFEICVSLLNFWFLEVMKGLCAKKHAKMKKSQQESAEKPYEKACLRPERVARKSVPDKENKVNFLKQLFL